MTQAVNIIPFMLTLPLCTGQINPSYHRFTTGKTPLDPFRDYHYHYCYYYYYYYFEMGMRFYRMAVALQYDKAQIHINISHKLSHHAKTQNSAQS
jgi:hypothetical protein